MDHFLMVFSRGASSAPTNKQISIFSKLREFLQDEEGIATAWAIFWMIICFAISGLSIDVTNAWKVRQILQTTADVTAHAGAIELRTVENDKIEAVVEVEANKYAALNMNESRYGDVLFNEDILVGYWDDDTRTFVEMVPGDELLVNAVRTITRQNETKNTAVGTFFLTVRGI